MLALFKDNTVHGEFREGGWFKLPDGRKASPAQAGWLSDDGYRLETIEDADPVPAGKIVNGTSVQVVAGKPKKVHDLVDEPAPSANPADYPLSAAEFEAGLIILDIDREQIAPAIKSAVSDPVAQAIALGAWRRLTEIRRDNAVLSLLKGVFMVSDDDIDAMWRQLVSARV